MCLGMVIGCAEFGPDKDAAGLHAASFCDLVVELPTLQVELPLDGADLSRLLAERRMA
jgi:hypothetical protein